MILKKHLAAFGAALLLTTQVATAQDTVDSILVFDASGSMWGQIDGINKIVIARDVVSNLLNELPASHRMGLIAYGHNRKGDCNDIQLLAPVGADRGSIRKAVLDLNPKGMTPMTAAVEMAAEELKYTENKATVILVSDGEETCHANPCDAVAALGRLGVGLTVHTVGFGLESKEAKNAREQLQCMAEATGGRFVTADNAQELATALSTVTAATAVEKKPEPVAPQTIPVTLQATDQQGGPVIRDGLVWTVRDGGTGEVIHSATDAGILALDLTKGIKDIRVERPADGASAEGAFNPAERKQFTLPIVVHYAAAISAPDTAAAGSTIRVSWEGPDKSRDYLSVEHPDKASRASTALTYTYTKKGSPLELRMPPEAGTYEIRYIQNQGYKTLARKSIEVTAVEASIEAPDTAAAGSTVRVNWEGPDYASDYLSVEHPDKAARGNTALTYTYTKKGKPLELRMPAEAGTYEIRYIQNQGYKVLARHAIEVTAVEASIEAPDTAAAGSTVRINWEGPDYASDYLSVEHPDKTARGNTSLTYTYTEKGNPLNLRMPAEAGIYEIRYIQNQGYKVLARHAIEVTAVEASIEAPDTAAAGSTVRINWEGPDYASDYLSVEHPDKVARGNTSLTYTYTEQGSPLNLRMPAEAGTYEIRYIQNQGYKVLARHAIEVTAVEASIEAPDTAAAGSRVRINWEGPDYASDYLSVEHPDKVARGNTSLTYTYTEKGKPLNLRMPAEAGTYEIRYIQNQGYKVLARKSIEVTAVEAGIEAPDTAVAGSTVQVSWEGPNYDSDYLSVEHPDKASRGNTSLTYTYTEQGSPLNLRMPEQPGTYEIRYIQNQGYKTLGRHTITVTEAP